MAGGPLPPDSLSLKWQVALSLSLDTLVTAILACDFLSSLVIDFRLRINLNRLRGGYFEIQSRARPPNAVQSADLNLEPCAAQPTAAQPTVASFTAASFTAAQPTTGHAHID